MDGRDRALDNVFAKRIWRTVKCNEAYLKSYRPQIDADTTLDTLLLFYNDQGPNSAFGMADSKTPTKVCRQPAAFAINRWRADTSVQLRADFLRQVLRRLSSESANAPHARLPLVN